MAYRLELQEVDHRHLVATLLHHLSEELPPDLTLLPTSGPELRTNALALALHSPALTAPLDRRDGFILSVPASSSTLALLLQLLATGLAIGADRGELVEVQEAAVVLGIRLGSCQVGTRRAS